MVEAKEELNDSVGQEALGNSFDSPIKNALRTSILSRGSNNSDDKYRTCTMIMLISGVRLPVEEKMLIWVQWSRGKKTADTAKKNIRPDTHQVKYKERFQIKAKMKYDGTGFSDDFESTLSVYTEDKHGGLLSTTQLDLSKFDDLGTEKYNILKLPLMSAQTNEPIEDAWIEVGLKSVAKETDLSSSMSKSQISPANLSNASPMNASQRSQVTTKSPINMSLTSPMAGASEDSEGFEIKKNELMKQIDRQQRINIKLKKSNPQEIEEKNTELVNLTSDMKQLERAMKSIDLGQELKEQQERAKMELENQHDDIDSEANQTDDYIAQKQLEAKQAQDRLDEHQAALQAQQDEEERTLQEHQEALQYQRKRVGSFFGVSTNKFGRIIPDKALVQ